RFNQTRALRDPMLRFEPTCRFPDSKSTLAKIARTFAPQTARKSRSRFQSLLPRFLQPALSCRLRYGSMTDPSSAVLTSRLVVKSQENLIAFSSYFERSPLPVRLALTNTLFKQTSVRSSSWYRAMNTEPAKNGLRKPQKT